MFQSFGLGVARRNVCNYPISYTNRIRVVGELNIEGVMWITLLIFKLLKKKRYIVADLWVSL